MSRFSPPEDRDLFTLPVRPAPDDIDANGHVNNVVYLRWAQDVATAHWRARVAAEEAARWAWVVARHEVDYRRPLHLGDDAVVRTWVGAPKGARFDRFVVVEGPHGACAEVRSDWVLLNAATGRPTRIPPDLLAPFVR